MIKAGQFLMVVGSVAITAAAVMLTLLYCYETGSGSAAYGPYLSTITAGTLALVAGGRLSRRGRNRIIRRFPEVSR